MLIVALGPSPSNHMSVQKKGDSVNRKLLKALLCVATALPDFATQNCTLLLSLEPGLTCTGLTKTGPSATLMGCTCELTAACPLEGAPCAFPNIFGRRGARTGWALASWTIPPEPINTEIKVHHYWFSIFRIHLMMIPLLSFHGWSPKGSCEPGRELQVGACWLNYP